MAATSTVPSTRLSCPSSNIVNTTIVLRIMAGTSRRRNRPRGTAGHTRKVRPSTKPRLQIFEPTTLPNASPCSPSNAARRHTASSGALVANATMVRPVINGVMPARCALSAQIKEQEPAQEIDDSGQGTHLFLLIPVRETAIRWFDRESFRRIKVYRALEQLSGYKKPVVRGRPSSTSTARR